MKDIEHNLPKYIHDKLAHEKQGVVELDMNKIGYEKVLGSGKLHAKIKITAKSFSANAVEKIKAAGGEAVIQPFSKKG